jgi:hypothetical protein
MKKYLQEAGYDLIRAKSAATMQRISPTGEARDFSIFIMVGKKAGRVHTDKEIMSVISCHG